MLLTAKQIKANMEKICFVFFFKKSLRALAGIMFEISVELRNSESPQHGSLGRCRLCGKYSLALPEEPSLRAGLQQLQQPQTWGEVQPPALTECVRNGRGEAGGCVGMCVWFGLSGFPSETLHPCGGHRSLFLLRRPGLSLT